MIIEKSGRVYHVKENEQSWTLISDMGKLSVSYNVSKSECASIEALKAFVAADPSF